MYVDLISYIFLNTDIDRIGIGLSIAKPDRTFCRKEREYIYLIVKVKTRIFCRRGEIQKKGS